MADDAVHHPAHYGGGNDPHETIKVIEHLGWAEGFNRACILKYIMRLGRKGDRADEIKDLIKIRNYAAFEIERLRKEEN